jgi:hypothetical protein
MDPTVPLATAIALLAIIAVFQMCIWLEMQWQTRQREELNRLLIMALFRMSKKEIAALEENARRVDGLGAVLLSALRERASDPALTANVVSNGDELPAHPAVEPPAPRAETDGPTSRSSR